MAARHKLTGKGLSIPVGIGIGLAANVGITLIGALIMAYMITNQTIAMERIGIGVSIIHLLAAAAGSWLAVTLTKKNKWAVCGILAAGQILILLSITAIFFDGVFHRIGLTVLLIAIGAMVPMLSQMRKKSPKNKIKIPAYR